MSNPVLATIADFPVLIWGGAPTESWRSTARPPAVAA